MDADAVRHGAVGVLKEQRKLPRACANASEAIVAICAGETGELRKGRAASAGAVPLLVGALRRHKKVPDVVGPAKAALLILCYTAELQAAALKAGADPDEIQTARDTYRL